MPLGGISEAAVEEDESGQAETASAGAAGHAMVVSPVPKDPRRPVRHQPARRDETGADPPAAGSATPSLRSQPHLDRLPAYPREEPAWAGADVWGLPRHRDAAEPAPTAAQAALSAAGGRPPRLTLDAGNLRVVGGGGPRARSASLFAPGPGHPTDSPGTFAAVLSHLPPPWAAGRRPDMPTPWPAGPTAAWPHPAFWPGVARDSDWEGHLRVAAARLPPPWPAAPTGLDRGHCLWGPWEQDWQRRVGPAPGWAGQIAAAAALSELLSAALLPFPAP